MAIGEAQRRAIPWASMRSVCDVPTQVRLLTDAFRDRRGVIGLVGGGSPVTSRDCERWPQDARERWAVRIGTISHLRELRGGDTIVPICARGSSEFAHGP